MYARPGQSREWIVYGAPSGEAGTATFAIEDGQGGVTLAPTTSGIVESPAGSGIYTITFTAPDGDLGDQFTLIFDAGDDTPAATSLELSATGQAPVSSELLDRVKARVETDLPDSELLLLIEEAQSEIRTRWGADRDEDTALVVYVDGGDQLLDIKRPIDTGHEIQVVESATGFGDDDVFTTLDEGDYEIRNGGRTLVRRGGSGVGFVTEVCTYRFAARVALVYVPVDDQPQRDEVTIKLVKLAVQNEAWSSEDVGDRSVSHLDYSAEREKLIGSLSPRKGLLMA